ncbi:MAG: 2-oxo-4-hydroxy-4-carboxy-5-ureidoimidazoline decarboxylase [Burkholderiaceae bacterium]|nr:2-oxo-4-hydroxy-4-carboxy-5-ureidoimidazoline decarboxylase [Burkholderiaceae bacterium]
MNLTPTDALTLDRINTAPLADVRASLSNLYEHSPWVAEAALASRPFSELAALKRAMAEAVRRAGRESQLALIRAHPELAGKAMLAGALTRDSSNEQSTSGLTHCSPEELQALHDLNTEYTARFGWPFVLAVRGPTGRGLTRSEIIATLRQRLMTTPQVEMDECLRQIDRIAEIRLHERMGLSGESS